MEIQGVDDRLESERRDHRNAQTMHFFTDGVVFLAKLQQFPHLAFELPVFIAQAEHLPLGNRNGTPAVWVRNGNMRQDLRVFLEELRVVLEILDDVFGFHSVVTSRVKFGSLYREEEREKRQGQSPPK